jgi:hypothetical protein
MGERGLDDTHLHAGINTYSQLARAGFASIENKANGVAFMHRAVACLTA